MRKNLLLTVISTLAIVASATAYSQIALQTELKDAYGTINVPVYIKCGSYVSITNTSSIDRRYGLGTRLCKQGNHCVENKAEILLKSGKKFTNTYYTIFEPSFSRVGQKPIECTNFVSGPENASQVKTATVFIS